jgi:hypothetical protein
MAGRNTNFGGVAPQTRPTLARMVLLCSSTCIWYVSNDCDSDNRFIGWDVNKPYCPFDAVPARTREPILECEQPSIALTAMHRCVHELHLTRRVRALLGSVYTAYQFYCTSPRCRLAEEKMMIRVELRSEGLETEACTAGCSGTSRWTVESGVKLALYSGSS